MPAFQHLPAMPEGLHVESILSLLYVISVAAALYYMYGRIPSGREYLWKLSAILFIILCWFQFIEPVVLSAIIPDHPEGSVFHIFEYSQALQDKGGEKISSRSLPLILFLAVLLALSMLQRIKTIPGLAFIILWLAFVLFPLNALHSGTGFLHSATSNSHTVAVRIFLPAGFMALATMFYAPGRFVSARKLHPASLIYVIPILLLFPAFFRSYTGCPIDLPFFLLQLVMAGTVYTLLKKYRHRKWKDDEPLAIVLMNMVLATELPGLHPIIESLVAGAGSAFVLYIFIVSLNYNEKDPAYFLWIIFGIGCWIAEIFKVLFTIQVHMPEGHTVTGLHSLFTSGLRMGSLSVYVFISTYILYGLLNRIITIKMSDAEGLKSKN